MKAAISIPDRLFEEAEAYSKRHRISRSRLCSQAVAAYLESKSASEVREKPDAVYSSGDSSADSVRSRMQETSLDAEDWSCAGEKFGGRR